MRLGRPSRLRGEKLFHVKSLFPLEHVAVTLAGGFPGAPDQTGVGSEVLDGAEARDDVDLVEDDEGEDLAN